MAKKEPYDDYGHTSTLKDMQYVSKSPPKLGSVTIIGKVIRLGAWTIFDKGEATQWKGRYYYVDLTFRG